MSYFNLNPGSNLKNNNNFNLNPLQSINSNNNNDNLLSSSSTCNDWFKQGGVCLREQIDGIPNQTCPNGDIGNCNQNICCGEEWVPRTFPSIKEGLLCFKIFNNNSSNIVTLLFPSNNKKTIKISIPINTFSDWISIKIDELNGGNFVINDYAIPNKIIKNFMGHMICIITNDNNKPIPEIIGPIQSPVYPGTTDPSILKKIDGDIGYFQLYNIIYDTVLKKNYDITFTIDKIKYNILSTLGSSLHELTNGISIQTTDGKYKLTIPPQKRGTGIILIFLNNKNQLDYKIMDTFTAKCQVQTPTPTPGSTLPPHPPSPSKLSDLIDNEGYIIMVYKGITYYLNWTGAYTSLGNGRKWACWSQKKGITFKLIQNDQSLNGDTTYRLRMNINDDTYYLSTTGGHKTINNWMWGSWDKRVDHYLPLKIINKEGIEYLQGTKENVVPGVSDFYLSYTIDIGDGTGTKLGEGRLYAGWSNSYIPLNAIIPPKPAVPGSFVPHSSITPIVPGKTCSPGQEREGDWCVPVSKPTNPPKPGPPPTYCGMSCKNDGNCPGGCDTCMDGICKTSMSIPCDYYSCPPNYSVNPKGMCPNGPNSCNPNDCCIKNPPKPAVPGSFVPHSPITPIVPGKTCSPGQEREGDWCVPVSNPTKTPKPATQTPSTKTNSLWLLLLLMLVVIIMILIIRYRHKLRIK